MLDPSVPFAPPPPPSPWRPFIPWALPLSIFLPLLPFLFSAPLYFVSAGGILGPTKTWLLLGSTDVGYCLAAYYMAVVALSVLCTMFVVGKRVPGSLLFGLASLPFWAGAAVALWRHRATAGETDLKAFGIALVFVEGVLAFGVLLSCVTLCLVAVAALLRLFSIRGPIIGALRPTARRNAMILGGVVAVAGWLVAIAVRHQLAWFQMPYGLWLMVFAVPAALLAAWRAPVAKTLAPEAAAEMVRTMVVLGVAMATAAVLTGVAGEAYARHFALDDLGRLYVPLDKRVSLLTTAAAGLHHHPILAAVDAGILFIALLVVPVACSGAARVGLSPRISQLAWIPLLVLAVTPGMIYARAFTRSAAKFGRPPIIAGSGIALVTTSENWNPLESHAFYFVSRDGQLRMEGSKRTTGERTALVVDGGARYGTVMRALAPTFTPEENASFDVVLSLPAAWQPDRKDLGEIAPLMGSGTSTLPVEIAPADSKRKPYDDIPVWNPHDFVAVENDDEWTTVVRKVEAERARQSVPTPVVIGHRAK
ncbi:hypothetical protein LVJ94_32095 [Pendulispora rubella]|uniref:Transmembrane protein n=1 Tax=Pendulispora rubella TaxID=2741070 RepID=A0ABZ2KS78_9BACT